MTLSSMVISRDWQEISVLECVLGGLHIGVEVEPEPQRARAKLAKSKIDALIVDCDLQGTAAVLRILRAGDPKNSVPLMIVSSARKMNRVDASRASFIFQKPISVEQAVHTLSAARNMILNGRLRYHREGLDAPVFLSAGGHKRLKAYLRNISQGGVGVYLEKQNPLTGRVGISFDLPGTKRSLKVQGEVAWADTQGHAGLRFLDLKPTVRRNLQLWLERRYFTH